MLISEFYFFLFIYFFFLNVKRKLTYFWKTFTNITHPDQRTKESLETFKKKKKKKDVF